MQNNPAAGFVTIDPAYGDRNTDETGTVSDRSTFNAKRTEAESCAQGVDDIKTKTRVQSKGKKRKRTGQRKVHSRQEAVVYFPKSDKESTNRG